MSKKAISHLSKDPHFKPLIKAIKLNTLDGDLGVYESLIRSITSQQLSVKAAATIHGRFLDLFADHFPAPKKVIKMELETLRSVGLSRQKASYIQNVAHFFIEENLLKKDWTNLTDEAIIDHLTQIKGVGKWTVQMILMFTLNRPDVFPIDDLGIRNAMVIAYNLAGKFPDNRDGQKALRKKLISIAETWSPYRTLACRYLWQSLN